MFIILVGLQIGVIMINLPLRVVHITFRLAVRPLPLCLPFLLFWRWLFRWGGRLGEGTSLCSRKSLCRFLWQCCDPLTLCKRTKKKKTRSRQDRHFNNYYSNSSRHNAFGYLTWGWLLEGGWLGVGPLLAGKRHQIGWGPEKGPMNARGRLELIWVPHWSTL